tara:strand:+ start:254 stop:862 length:609 start_codon:yes stop_codon:yes gene_type:complete
MKILIACEYSGRVKNAFIAKGHNAISCDIRAHQLSLFNDTNCLDSHKIQDVKLLLNDYWDMIIAFPPCTYLSKAGARWMFPNGELNKKRYRNALKAKEFFMLFYNHSCNKVCIENPQQMKIIDMPKHSQCIQPYMFGDPYSKKTLLWLKGLPLLKPTNLINDYTPWVKSSKHRGKYQPPTKNSKDRSLSFHGIARAMADQWG